MTDSHPSAGPDFVCIGAQKAGTTWLYHSLSLHQDVWMPPVKELHFFDLLCAHPELLGVEAGKWATGLSRLRPFLHRPSLSTARWLYRFYGVYPSTEWYHSLFARDFTGGRLTGDITPAYSTLDERGVSFAREVLGEDCRVLLVVRNPIERFWSSIKMFYRWKDNSLDTDSCQEILNEATDPRHRLRGEYRNMIQLWRTRFGSKFKVLLYDRLREASDDFLQTVIEFLDLNPARLSSTLDDRVNADPKKKRLPVELREGLVDLYSPQIEALDEFIPGVAEKWLKQ